MVKVSGQIGWYGAIVSEIVRSYETLICQIKGDVEVERRDPAVIVDVYTKKKHPRDVLCV